MAGQGLVGLGGAAGASEGFETLLARRLLERKQAEEERSNLAQEDIRRQTLTETASDRDVQRQLQLLSAKDLMESRRAAAEDRDLSRAAMTSRDAADRASREDMSRQLRAVQTAGQENQLSIAKLAAAGRPPQLHQVIGPDGTPIWVTNADAIGQTAVTGNTAQDRQRSARVDAARGFMDRLNTLREKINTKVGPEAGATGIFRKTMGAIGSDPDVSEYQKTRMAAGRSLAVAVMGAQNLSDADAAAWGNMFPDATTDRVTAERLMRTVGNMLENSASIPGAPQTPMSSHPRGAGAGTGAGTSTTLPGRTQNWGRDASGRPVRVP